MLLVQAEELRTIGGRQRDSVEAVGWDDGLAYWRPTARLREAAIALEGEANCRLRPRENDVGAGLSDA